MAKKSKKSAPKKATAKTKSKSPAKKSTSVKATARKSVGNNNAAAPKANHTASTGRVLEYKLFTEDSVRNLEDQVNYHIGKGWAPVGGVVVQGTSVFIQTMVRNEI